MRKSQYSRYSTLGLVSYFKLSQKSGDPYRLARAKNNRVLKEQETLHRIGSADKETYLLGTEEQIENFEGLLHRPSSIEFIIGLIAGIFFIAFNFPIGLTKLGHAPGWSWVTSLGVFAKFVLTSLFGVSASTRQNQSFNSLCSGVEQEEWVSLTWFV